LASHQEFGGFILAQIDERVLKFAPTGDGIHKTFSDYFPKYRQMNFSLDIYLAHFDGQVSSQTLVL
jgi:hypothetical protein